MLLVAITILVTFNLLAVVWLFSQWHHQQRQQQLQAQQEQNQYQQAIEKISHIEVTVAHALHEFKDYIRSQVAEQMHLQQSSFNQRFSQFTQLTEQHLEKISTYVNQRLHEGFEKTTATFGDVVKRLILIDEAQKRISELSSHVISLQEILVDKNARGAFGEMQLNNLLENFLPQTSYHLQHVLSNGKRADCILLLPPPTGHLVIDAKFPLENYQLMHNKSATDAERKSYAQLFRKDILRHIQDIRQKYILPPETADGAMMFLPAEAIFAEIHANFPEVVAAAQKACVWLVSPTTIMAILTTVRAVLKDADTRKQVHIIQEHLNHLAQDFTRFQKRMDQLIRHIDQAQQDAKEVHTSANKITQRFEKIEKVELELESVNKEPADVA